MGVEKTKKRKNPKNAKECWAVMTPKEQKFCELWLRRGDSGKAIADIYLEAGYSHPRRKEAYICANKLMNTPVIKMYLEEMNEKIGEKVAEKIQWSKEKLVNKFEAIHDRCMQEVPVLDNKGQKIGVYRFEPHASVNSLKEIGKILGHYELDNTQKKISTEQLALLLGKTTLE